MVRKSFLDQKAPPGYVAGVGRGATGFVTSAEWGKIRAESENAAKNGLNPVDADDLEAASVFDAVDSALVKRKAKKRRLKSPIEGEGIQTADISVGESIKSISAKFQDVKRGLAVVSADEWANLPAPVDLTMRNKRLREERRSQQRFYRNSDGVSLSLMNTGQTDEALDTETDLNRAKELVLDARLKLEEGEQDEAVDKHAYLAELGKTATPEVEVETKVKGVVGDYAKTRALFSKLVQTAPAKAENWIAYSRLEYDAKRYVRAREIIQQGCEMCPRSEEAWLVNLEINAADLMACKVIVADALKRLNKSLPLWLKAVEYEQDQNSKARVIRKALEFVPRSETLWLALVEGENSVNVKVRVLEKAVELVPASLKLWLLWSELEDPSKALQVLERARAAVAPKDIPVVWISQAKTQERLDENELKVNRIVEGCFMAVKEYTYTDWMRLSEECDMEGFTLVVRAITLRTLSGFSPGLDEILNECDKLREKGRLHTARAMLSYVNETHPDNLEAWFEAISLEKEMTGDTKDELFLTYELALAAQPACVELYLMYAKDKWGVGDTSRAREIIFEGMSANAQNEDLWFAAVKLEHRSGTIEIALDLFEQCLKQLERPSHRVWVKYVTMLRNAGENNKALDTVDMGLQKYPQEPKLHLQKGQICEDNENFDAALKAYEKGTKECSKNAYVWTHLSKLYERLGKSMRARSVLDEGIGKNPFSDVLHAAKVRMEWENRALALKLMARALQQVPQSGLLWSLNIELAQEDEKRGVYAMALKTTREDPQAVVAIALDMWKRGEVAKAKIFFESCLKKRPDYGDLYVEYYAYLLQNGDLQDMKKVEKEFLRTDPRHGPRWCAITKKVTNLNAEPLALLRESAVGVLEERSK